MEKKSSSGSGITFTGVLTCIFIALKLTGHITWSWLWVLSPIWISWGIVFLIFAIIGIISIILEGKK